MKTQTGFITEFLTEINFVLTQEDYENKLESVIAPIRNLFLQEQNLLGFSLARYCEANTRIAFFCEWYFQVLKITKDNSTLILANQEYLKKSVPMRLRGLPNLYKIIDNHIHKILLPKQIGLLHAKNAEFVADLKQQYPYLNKFLSKEFLGKLMVGDVISISKIYKENLTVSEFIEAQSQRSSFVQIGLPCILGLSYTFNQPDNPINPDGVKWVLLENLLKNIATLHQINSTKDLEQFVYQSKLSDSQEFDWLRREPAIKMKIAINDTETRNDTQKIKDKIYQKSKDQLENIVFPKKYKEMLKDLLDWSGGEF